MKIVENHECEYCHKSFTNELILLNHSCEKKRRFLWKDEKYIRYGFYAYQKFYKISMNRKKEKTYEEFANSSYFTSFTKFGKYLLDINAVEPELFVEFIIKANIKLSDWVKPYVYELWIRELNKKESPERAVERNILLMEQWSKDYNEPWFDFFRKVNTNLATKWIKSGRISPWLLYSGYGDSLFCRMSNEQLEMILDVIDPIFWNKKIALNKKEVETFKNILDEVNL